MSLKSYFHPLRLSLEMFLYIIVDSQALLSRGYICMCALEKAFYQEGVSSCI